MKKKITCLAFALLLLTGCGKTPKLANGSDAVVSFKNGDMISVDDLYSEMKDTYALSTLMTMIDKYVFENEFKDYEDTAKEYAESYINSMLENYENEDALLKDIQAYTGMNSIEAYKNYLYTSYMQSHATEEYAKLQITEEEIKNYYEKEIVGDIELSHILITPDVKDDMTDEEKEAKETEAKNKANEVLSKLKNASKDELKEAFASLAKEYSNDTATANNGGSLGKINKNDLSDSYDELVNAAYSLNDGEYYDDVITTELGYHIILKTASYEKASLKDSKTSILKTLGQEYIKNNKTASIDALQYYRKKHGMNIEDTNLQNQYGYYINNVLNSLNSSEN